MNPTSMLANIIAMSPPPDGAPHQEEAFFVQMLLMLGIFLVFYFLLIRPQSKRNKETKKMQETLGKGARIVTTGGMLGTVHKVTDDIITVEVAEGVRVKFQRAAIHETISEGEPPKGATS